MKSKVIISLFETVRLSVSISLRNLCYSLNSIKEIVGPKLSTMAGRSTLNLRLSPEQALVFVVLMIFNQREREREDSCLSQYSVNPIIQTI